MAERQQVEEPGGCRKRGQGEGCRSHNGMDTSTCVQGHAHRVTCVPNRHYSVLTHGIHDLDPLTDNEMLFKAIFNTGRQPISSLSPSQICSPGPCPAILLLQAL